MSYIKRHIEKLHLRLDRLEDNSKLDDEYWYNDYLEKLNIQLELDKLSERERVDRIIYTKS